MLNQIHKIFTLISIPHAITAESIHHAGYNVTCYGASNGSINVIIVGTSGPYTYHWSNGATTKNINGLTAGTYVLTLTNSYNQISYYEVELVQPDALQFQLIPTNLSSEGSQDGQIDVEINGGNPPYKFFWSNGSTSESIAELSAGYYSLTLKDYTNCSISSGVYISEPGELIITSITSPTYNGVYNVSCNGANDGSISVDVVGGVPPYTFEWSNGAFTKDIYNLEGGDYELHVYDDAGGYAEASIYLAVPQDLSISMAVTQISCYDCNNGIVTVTTHGGFGPFNFVWEDGGNGAIRDNLPAGEYSVQVTNNYGCRTNGSKVIFQPPQNAWDKGGNSGTDPNTDFIGTKDSVALAFRTNNIERFRINSDGSLRIPSLSGTIQQNLAVDADGTVITTPIQFSPWLTQGNTGTTSTSFLGTTDDVKLRIRTAAQNPSWLPRMTFTEVHEGFIGIAKDDPEHMLVINSIETQNPVSEIGRLSNVGHYEMDELWFDSTGASIAAPLPATAGVGVSAIQLINSTTGETSEDGLTISTFGNHAYIRNREEDGALSVFAPKGLSFLTPNGNMSLWAAGSSKLSSSGIIFNNMSPTRNLIFQNNGQTAMTIRPNGQVLIGTSETVTGYKLAVRGKIRAEEIRVDMDAWGDFVFDKDYQMHSINDLEKYITLNKHLPGIPSADLMQQNGLDLGEMQRLQMVKIEELTLYIIELQKQLNELKSKDKM